MTDQQVEQATIMRQEYFLKILRENPLPAFPGVLELISTVREAEDFGLAIATSSTREKSRGVLESARIPYQQMVYITGSDVTDKKPHPELFLLAAQRLNLAPEKCLVIEDAPNGIEAAHAAGCKCIAVTNSATADKLAAADLIVTTLVDVSLDMIMQLIRGN